VYTSYVKPLPSAQSRARAVRPWPKKSCKKRRNFCSES